MTVAAPTTSLLLFALAVLALTANAAAKDPAAASPPQPPQILPGVTVQGQPNPITHSDHRLTQMKRSLPELGGKPAPTRADRARDYLARHADPEAASGQQRQMMEQARQPEGPALSSH